MALRNCSDFLAWALPRMGLAPPGYRRVRRQICKRLHRRLGELRLRDLADYRRHLEANPDEWATVKRRCHITISRFYRDRRVFDRLASEIMPALAAVAHLEGRRVLRVWSAGCASGEEPYSVALIWHFALAARLADLTLAITATDADDAVLARGAHARYPAGCLRELPPEWTRRAFRPDGKLLQLRPEFRADVTFLHQDLRTAAPEGRFDLVLRRNLAFTYFDEDGRREAVARLAESLVPGGALVIGWRERLPTAQSRFDPWVAELGIFRSRSGPRG